MWLQVALGAGISAAIILVSFRATSILIKSRVERRRHNDRDIKCIYWWGDRSGYDIHAQCCTVCNPDGNNFPTWSKEGWM